MNQDTRNVIENGAAAIRAHFGIDFPRNMVVLGSGIGRFADNLEGAASLPYAAIPGFAPSPVMGHAGKLMAFLRRIQSNPNWGVHHCPRATEIKKPRVTKKEQDRSKRHRPRAGVFLLPPSLLLLFPSFIKIL